MKKPRIGIAGNLLINNEPGFFAGSWRTYVNHNYITSIIKAGGVPVLLPVIPDEEDTMMQMEGLDGVLLTGGSDVDPHLYGEDILPECGAILPEVDQFDLHVIHAADKMHMPLFGICRGIQILNVAYGGTIYQSQDKVIPNCLKHVQDAPRYQPTHDITTEEGTFIREVLGEKARVNSFHHQSVHDVAPGFKASAHANDGVIEAIERQNGSFMAAVQFHPEMMAEYDNPRMIALFKAFVDKCRS